MMLSALLLVADGFLLLIFINRRRRLSQLAQVPPLLYLCQLTAQKFNLTKLSSSIILYVVKQNSYFVAFGVMIYMPCYHPLAAFVKGVKSNGSKDLVFLKGFNFDSFDSLPSSFPLFVDGKRRLCFKSQIVRIPCGQCIGCLLAHSREWAVRCLLELKYHNSAYFITLTYDDAHLPRTPCSLIVGDDDVFFGTLRKRDFQLFMKRLRFHFCDQQLRFFGCGEYGSKSLRPHYHIIVFGLELNDLKFEQVSKAKVSGEFSKLYSSRSVESCWKDSDGNLIGLVRIGSVTFNSCAYVARYTCKKQRKDDRTLLDFVGAEREFVLMSRRPGIARRYFDEHKGEIYDFDKIYFSSGGKAFESKPPRYFDKLYDLDSSDHLIEIKALRKLAAEDSQQIKLQNTSLTYSEYLESCESIKEESVKKLVRCIE